MSPSLSTSTTIARLLVVLAACLWSLGSLFTRLLTEPTALGLDEPRLDPLHIAFFRGLFAGLVFVPFIAARPAQIRFHPIMLGMVACFGTLSALYMSALVVGPAANAILLQNTAPFWVYVIGVYLLGDPGDRQSWRAILLGMAGAGVILLGNWPWHEPIGGGQTASLLMGLGSGITYALVVLCLRFLRDESSQWLTALNLCGSAVVIGGFVLAREGSAGILDWFAVPSLKQLLMLVVFGTVQMAIPYWLFARSLRSISAQEAGFITLIEPVLNPVWAYLISPEKDAPTPWTLLGGLVLLVALGWRYLPRKAVAPIGDLPSTGPCETVPSSEAPSPARPVEPPAPTGSNTHA